MQGMSESAAPTAQGMSESRGAGAPTVRVDPVRLQRIGVRYAVARQEPLGLTLRAEASVMVDEGRTFSVTMRTGGWVERLYVDKTGQTVQRGQPLLEVYSPELVTTQRELVLALDQEAAREAASPPDETDDHAGEGDEGPAPAGRSLVDAARRRLELWGMGEAEIEQLMRTRKVRRTVNLGAPAAGVVLEKNVLRGGRAEAGQNLYVVADLSTVWVEARVFERDLASVRLGQPATITVAAYPGDSFAGKVSFIYPSLDPATRTVAVRLDVPNASGRLKPGMFATVSFDVSSDRPVLVVPSSAVIETGERAFVLVKRGEGLFEPREVKVGGRAEERVAIAENLAPGDTVVASANFLIDSEANLMAFMGGMIGMGMPPGQMRMEMQGMEGMEGAGQMEGMEGMEQMGDMDGKER